MRLLCLLSLVIVIVFIIRSPRVMSAQRHYDNNYQNATKKCDTSRVFLFPQLFCQNTSIVFHRSNPIGIVIKFLSNCNILADSILGFHTIIGNVLSLLITPNQIFHKHSRTISKQRSLRISSILDI